MHTRLLHTVLSSLLAYVWLLAAWPAFAQSSPSSPSAVLEPTANTTDSIPIDTPEGIPVAPDADSYPYDLDAEELWQKEGTWWLASGMLLAASPLPLYAKHTDMGVVETLGITAGNALGSTLFVGGSVLLATGLVFGGASVVLFVFETANIIQRTPSEQIDYYEIAVVLGTVGLVGVAVGVGAFLAAPSVIDATSGSVDRALGIPARNQQDAVWAATTGALVGASTSFLFALVTGEDVDLPTAAFFVVSGATLGSSIGYSVVREPVSPPVRR